MNSNEFLSQSMRLFATVFNKTDNLGGSQAAMVEPELGINRILDFKSLVNLLLGSMQGL